MSQDFAAPTSEEDLRELVFALCHEIGNLVAAIRLEAHLLDGESGDIGLARSAISIEDLSSRVAALLTQVRPLLRADLPADVGRVAPAALLANLRGGFAERGAGAVHLDIAAGSELPPVVGDPERSNALLWLIALGAVEAVESAGGRVSIEANELEDHVEISVRNDGAADSELADWSNAAQRGRSLVCQLAHALLTPLGGFVRVAVDETSTRVDLCFARADGGATRSEVR